MTTATANDRADQRRAARRVQRAADHRSKSGRRSLVAHGGSRLQGPSLCTGLSLRRKTLKDKAIRAKHDEVMKAALQGIKAVPNEADPAKPGENPSAKAEAELAKARPWIGKIPGQVIFEQMVQEAFAEKLRLIHEATAKQKEKEKAGGGDAKSAAGGPGAAHGPGPKPAAGGQPATPATATASHGAPPTAAVQPPAPKPQPPAPPAAHAQPPAGHADAKATDHQTDHAHADASSSTPATAQHGDAHANSPAGNEHGAHADHGKDAHADGKDGHADGKEGHGKHDPETEALSAQHQELVALVNGIAASAQAKGIVADNAINMGLTGLGVAASIALTPLAGAAIGGISFLISRAIGKEKKEKQKHAREIIEMIQTIEDPAAIDKILAAYAEGETDLEQLQGAVKNALQDQGPPAKGKDEKPEHAAAPAGNRTPAHGGDKHGDDKHGDKKKDGDKHGAADEKHAGEEEEHESEGEHGDGDHHGGVEHRLHQGEEIMHVGHVAAEGASAAAHGLHHALGPILAPVAGVIAAFKLGLGISEYSHLRAAIAKKKQVEEALKSKGAPVGPQASGNGTPPGGKH